MDAYVFAYMRNPIILFLTALYIVFWVGVVYLLVVLACWSKRGRPNFWPWARRFVLTRAIVRYARPTVEGEDEEFEEYEDAEGTETNRIEPKALTSPWAFFTSSSPLDDLLVTYEVTRPFVRPIHLTLRRRRTQDVEAGEVAATAAATSSVDVKNEYEYTDDKVGEKSKG